MTNFEHLKLGGPIAEGKLGGSLPDLDTLTPEELEKLADEAREEMSALGELWAIISEATVEEKLGIASLALLGKIHSLIRFELGVMATSHPEFIKAYHLLKKVNSTEERISFAIAVLEGVMTDPEDDDDDDEEKGEGDEEIEEALSQKDLNKAFQLAVSVEEAEAIKEFYAGASLY